MPFRVSQLNNNVSDMKKPKMDFWFWQLAKKISVKILQKLVLDIMNQVIKLWSTNSKDSTWEKVLAEKPLPKNQKFQRP